MHYTALYGNCITLQSKSATLHKNFVYYSFLNLITGCYERFLIDNMWLLLIFPIGQLRVPIYVNRRSE